MDIKSSKQKLLGSYKEECDKKIKIGSKRTNLQKKKSINVNRDISAKLVFIWQNLCPKKVEKVNSLKSDRKISPRIIVKSCQLRKIYWKN